MAGPDPAIHVFDFVAFKSWMAATSAAMTIQATIIPR
jgi:hypothetical protein